ncbi:MAG: hypothetical protein AVDCRST_MAG19-4240 [uncultured Thermomicrobiales bacterium]|uniref:Uncharacterized protein n=1 Tax=uncultured Thermomicrobiales bacterium TaxID=1645740 RepID=A0A6J4VLX1_9BACT|nr:MAG: hypothetical protein AVDCRST_MAG19-4240 [uncultured Thermomicrobiales bacterium]
MGGGTGRDGQSRAEKRDSSLCTTGARPDLAAGNDGPEEIAVFLRLAEWDDADREAIGCCEAGFADGQP